MFNFDYITKDVIKEQNLKGSEIPDYPCRILIIRGLAPDKQCICYLI